MRKIILVIDHEDSVLNLFKWTFDKSDFKVTTASNSDNGILMAEIRKPDLIFLNLKMPRTDVLDTLKELSKFASDVPVCFLTEDDENCLREIEDIKNYGFDCKVCKKPVNSSKIQNVVNDILTRKTLL